MSTNFFTNEGENTLLNKFAGVFEHNPDIACFDALVGFFRASGYFALRPWLEQVPTIRILVGIDVDKITAKYHQEGLLFKGDSEQALQDFRDSLKGDIQESRYSREVEAGILQFVEDIVSGKVQIKAHPSRKLHAKIYIMRPEPFNEHKAGTVITGSSNLSNAGLGVTDSRNYEFNVLLHRYDDVRFATDEFEKLWKEGVDVLPAELKKVTEESYLNDRFTPFEIYMKFLIEYFGSSVDFDPNSVEDLPKGFKRLTYQIDAVHQGYQLLRQHGGFFLADVVGLGKTIVAALIAKKFFYTNGYPSYNSCTLVVVPPALKTSWDETLYQFGLHNYEIVTNGSLHKITRPEKYDLIIVDEAHKFRNDTAEAYTQLQKLCKTPTRRTINGIRQAKHVILVSATPLNNRPEDIRNLVYLFQDGRNTTLPIGNLNSFFAKRIKRYRGAKKLDIEAARKEVAAIYEELRLAVIQPLTVRRTRTDLRDNKQYAEDLEKQGIHFPEVAKPRKLLYKLDDALDVLYDRTTRLLSDPTEGLCYNRYRAIQFLVPRLKLMYANADLLSAQLAKIMKTLLIKRLDSSFHAFRQSMKRFLAANDAMLQMFHKGRIYIAPNIDVNEYILEDREEELIDLIVEAQATDPTIQVCKPADFEEGFIEGLERDQAILQELVDSWNNVDQDPKLDELFARLDSDMLDPARNPTGKLVMFSESQETTAYLAEHLKAAGYRTLAIDSSNRYQLRDTIRANFDANIPEDEKTDDYDILISTEVLAEGVNLHRANVIVNYDTPWNATRLMQRIGRVNRIGSIAPYIHNYVFYPTTNVNNDIELEKRAIMKLQAFHTALGEDSQIYSEDEEINTFGLFDNIDEILEEERDESLTFLMELRDFRDKEPGEFRRIRNMPLRARCGRQDKTRLDTSLVFLRNQRVDGFYFLAPEGELQELSFVECARLFQAKVTEKSRPLHDLHHEQVNATLESFGKKVQKEIVSAKAVDTKAGPAETRALAYLNAFMNLPITGEGDKDMLNAAQKAIRQGRFQELVRQINRLKKSQQKKKVTTAVLLDKLIKILAGYPLDIADDEDSTHRPTNDKAATKPEIVISESFCGA